MKINWSNYENMKKKIRKPRLSVPHWVYLDRDGCWNCPDRNNCGNCKANKEVVADKKKQRYKKEKQKLKNNKGGYEE